MHAVEVAFESIYMPGPEATELSQPGIHLLERFRFQPVEAALCVHRGFHETGLAQHSQVLGHGRLRHTKLTLDLSDRLLGRDQEAQYRAAVRLRNDFENRFHSLHILQRAYTCQGIFRGDFCCSELRVRSEYDYCDFEVDTTRAGMPKSFGGFSRIEDRPKHPASRENPDNFGSLHAGRQWRNSGSAI